MPATAKIQKAARRTKTAFAAELRDARDAAARSPANAQLRRIVRLLDRVAKLANEWGNAHGPANGCRCDFCRLHGDNPTAADTLHVLAEDVAGVRWMASATASLVGGMVAEPVEPN